MLLFCSDTEQTRGRRLNASAPTPREAARRRLLETLRRDGPMARVELGQHLTMSPASVSDLTASLLEEGVLVVEGAGGPGALLLRGRPKQRLFFAEGLGSVIGVWIGHNRLELRLVDSSGRTRAADRIDRPLRDLGAPAILDAIGEAIDRFRAAAGPVPDLKAVGVACQGYVDSVEGVVPWSPVLTARDLPLASGLRARLHRPVLVENDASAIAFALAQRDPALREGRTACLMIGDGVGLGLLINGELYRGARSGGGEFGHVRLRRGGPQCRCGGRGCIEAFLADYAVHRDVQLVDHCPAPAGSLLPSEETMRSSVERARGGDPALMRIFREAGEVLGDAVGIIIQTLEPDHVVICGPGTRAMDLLQPSFEAALEDQTLPELRAMTKIHLDHSTAGLLTEGVVIQALRELDMGLARAKAA
jgi:predicted NBD/HSP70 family sugar kinase